MIFKIAGLFGWKLDEHSPGVPPVRVWLPGDVVNAMTLKFDSSYVYAV